MEFPIAANSVGTSYTKFDGGGTYVEEFLDPLGEPVIKKAEWINGRLVEMD